MATETRRRQDEDEGIYAHPRWEEFQDRLAALNNGTWKQFGPSKLRHWLKESAADAIVEANRFLENNDSRFVLAVANAEKFKSLLQMMRDGDLTPEDPQ